MARRAGACLGADVQVADLRRLPGGASRETWSFDATLPDGRRLPLILRRDPGGRTHDDLTRAVGEFGIGRDTERRLLEMLAPAGISAPPVRFALSEEEGGGFVMDRLRGETGPRRILNDAAYAAARERLAADCGLALARLHALPLPDLPPLPDLDALTQIRFWRGMLDHLDVAQPVFEHALNWLEDRRPERHRRVLVHGDFRLGNLLVDETGLVAALDWELAHLGDPLEDLGWLCVRSWRFGGARPVGGFGDREALYAAYERAGGGPVGRREAHYWEVFGTLRWGGICLIQAFTHLRGLHRSVELAAVGRRVTETEHDLLKLLDEGG
ncbi:MAG: phosphotransferase family protein [Alphaproteobacteria bacterium]|nr:phosphotransferase family protein [Alphaproteobacteria bacterium]